MQLHFADDSQEQPVEIYHKLKLYDEADPNNPSTKKPVRHLLKAASPCPQPLQTDSVVTNARETHFYLTQILLPRCLWLRSVQGKRTCSFTTMGPRLCLSCGGHAVKVLA